PCERSVTEIVSLRRSPNTTSGSPRSNQNIRLPQQGSSTGRASSFISSPHPSSLPPVRRSGGREARENARRVSQHFPALETEQRSSATGANQNEPVYVGPNYLEPAQHRRCKTRQH